MNERVAAVLPAWSRDLPGYHAVLAMHAFGLEESGRYDEAEASARAALALDPLDARAHHVMAHVFEMTDRAEAGERWLADHAEGWANDTVVATHCWWHRGLFQLALRRGPSAPSTSTTTTSAPAARTRVADLIDASALLWRIELAGGDAGGALARARRRVGAAHRRRASAASTTCTRCSRSSARATGSAPTGSCAPCEPRTRGRPATARRRDCSASPRAARCAAFGRGDDMLAITLLASLPRAGAPPRRQPRAARRPAPDRAARHGAARPAAPAAPPARGDGSIRP